MNVGITTTGANNIGLGIGSTNLPGAWTAWTPTLSATFTIGNGTSTFYYSKYGNTVFFRGVITFGSTTTIGGSLGFTLPFTAIDYASSNLTQIAMSRYYDSSAAIVYAGHAVLASITTCAFRTNEVSGSQTIIGLLSATNPFTWAVGDVVTVQGFYEIA